MAQLERGGPLVSVDSIGAVVGFRTDRTWMRVGASGFQLRDDGSVGLRRRRTLNWTNAPDEVRAAIVDEAVLELGLAARHHAEAAE